MGRWTDGGDKKESTPKCALFFGDPYGNRTHVFAVRGRCLSLLTNGPCVLNIGIITQAFRKIKPFLKKSLKKFEFFCRSRQTPSKTGKTLHFWRFLGHFSPLGAGELPRKRGARPTVLRKNFRKKFFSPPLRRPPCRIRQSLPFWRFFPLPLALCRLFCYNCLKRKNHGGTP